MSEFNRGMIEAEKKYATPIHPDLQNYLDTRHLPSKAGPYVPPTDNGQIAPYKSTSDAAFDLVVGLAKPVVALSVVAGVVWVVVVSAAAAVGAVFVFVSEYAVLIGGGVFAVAIAVIGIGSLFGGSGESGTGAKQGGTGGQIINVTVNVAGQSVTTNTNQK